mmetsp:Transcript_7392/g.8454  ORF Transcript_7392/g.8454 Transcript_7392/m.8454 type:complete len:455 (-) Transcript_7392:373-1737(-)
MENKFIPDAIDIVSKAIAADNDGEYQNALNLYRDALGRFTMGLKYEKNDARKKLILERVEGYMKRAEELRDYVNKQNEVGNSKSSGGTGMKKKGDGTNDDDADEEKNKLRGALSGAIVTEKPDVKWDDVAGLEGAKDSLKETVVLPTRFPQLFTGKRRPFKGILLYGPPGTGKSYLAKAVATEADSTFFSVSSSDLVSKWQGESERLVKNLFEMARETGTSNGGRSIIFIDEVDSLCGSRSEGESDSARRIKTEFLVQMDGVGKKSDNVLVLGATNVPWELDAAIRRRFEKRVYIPLPEAEARTYMVKLNLGDTPHSLTEDDFDQLGTITNGASGSDIKVLVQEALMQPLRTCQKAQQFQKDHTGKYLLPCDTYPNCPKCPPKLSSDKKGKDYTCKVCGALRMQLWDVPPEQLQAPDVSIKDFTNVLKHSFSSVSPQELKEYDEWTKQFGQEGA